MRRIGLCVRRTDLCVRRIGLCVRRTVLCVRHIGLCVRRIFFYFLRAILFMLIIIINWQ